MSNSGDTNYDYTALAYGQPNMDEISMDFEFPILNRWYTPTAEYNDKGLIKNIVFAVREYPTQTIGIRRKKMRVCRAYCEDGVGIAKLDNKCIAFAPPGKHICYTYVEESIATLSDGENLNPNSFSQIKQTWNCASNSIKLFNLSDSCYYINTDCPVFEKDIPKEYWDSGDISDAININKEQINFVVTVQPTFDGQITVTWNTSDTLIKQMRYVNIYVSPGDESVNKVLLAGNIGYETGKYLTSYYDCSQKLGAGYVGTFTMFINATYTTGDVTPLMYVRLEKGKKPQFWGAGGLTEPINTNICTITVKVAGKGGNPDVIKPPTDNAPTDPDMIPDIDDDNIMERGANLATTYKITEQKLKQIGEKLWSFSITDVRFNLSSAPIENIVSIKLMPTAQSSSQVSQILVGNMDTGVSGNVVNTINPRVIGTIDVPAYYDNFLDYEPYTQCSIYLPFAGFKSLQSNYIVGHAVSVKYTYDVVTGSCKIAVLSDDKTFAEFDAQCGIDLPLTSSNRAQIESAQLASFVGAVTTGNIMPLLDTAIKTPTYNSTGSSNSTCAAQMRLKCFITVDRPVADLPYSFPHDVGIYCGITCQIGKLSGFTVCNPNVDLSGIPCLAAERDMLLDILTSGFYA